jgi:hypothetical protein
METQGKKEIQEAVVTAALVAIATGLVGFGFEVFRRRWFKEEPKKKADPPSTP